MASESRNRNQKSFNEIAQEVNGYFSLEVDECISSLRKLLETYDFENPNDREDFERLVSNRKNFAEGMRDLTCSRILRTYP
jgi:hypothetical protein